MPLYTKVCKTCGSAFHGNPSSQYCSIPCRPSHRVSREHTEAKCQTCGDRFVPGNRRGAPARYCSSKCRRAPYQAKKRLPPTRSCKMCGEQFVRATGSHNQFCGEDCKKLYGRQRDHERTRARLGEPVPKQCVTCGDTWIWDPKSRVPATKKYCSPQCKPEKRGTVQKNCLRCGREFTARRHVGSADFCTSACRTDEAGRIQRRIEQRKAAQQRQRDTRRIRAAQAKLARAARGTQGKRIWVTTPCVVCRHRFATTWSAKMGCASVKTCSDACSRRNEKEMRKIAFDRYKTRKRGAFVKNVFRRKVFEADGWKCHICRKPIKRDAKAPHPLSPTIDHVIPLAKGGTHEPGNCRAAHFRCNSLKSDRTAGDQLLLLAVS